MLILPALLEKQTVKSLQYAGFRGLHGQALTSMPLLPGSCCALFSATKVFVAMFAGFLWAFLSVVSDAPLQQWKERSPEPSVDRGRRLYKSYHTGHGQATQPLADARNF